MSLEELKRKEIQQLKDRQEKLSDMYIRDDGNWTHQAARIEWRRLDRRINKLQREMT